MWAIDKKYGLAEPTVGSFIWFRIGMVLEYLLLVIPVALLIVKVMQWSGDYLVLVFLLATALVKFIMMWIYPKIIMPLFSSFEELPEYASPIIHAIKDEAINASCNPDKIYL